VFSNPVFTAIKIPALGNIPDFPVISPAWTETRKQKGEKNNIADKNNA